MIKDKLLSEITEYAEANKIKDVDKLVNKMLTRGFSIEKFGETPSKKQSKPKVIEKIVEKEIIKKVPFEVIKEVTVEKIVKVSDDAETTKLLKIIDENELEYNENLRLLKEQRTAQTQVIMKLNKDKDILKEEYEAKLKLKEEEITKMKSSKDFYGE